MPGSKKSSKSKDKDKSKEKDKKGKSKSPSASEKDKKKSGKDSDKKSTKRSDSGKSDKGGKGKSKSKDKDADAKSTKSVKSGKTDKSKSTTPKKEKKDKPVADEEVKVEALLNDAQANPTIQQNATTGFLADKNAKFGTTMQPPPQQQVCLLHGKPLKFYCEQQEALACYDCTVMGPFNTQLHRISNLDEAFRYRFKNINKSIVDLIVPKREQLIA